MYILVFVKEEIRFLSKPAYKLLAKVVVFKAGARRRSTRLMQQH